MRLRLSLILVITSTCLMAQNFLGIEAGPSWSANKETIVPNATGKAIQKVYFSINYQADLDHGLFLRTGIQYLTKGTSHKNVQWLDDSGFEVGRVDFRNEQEYVVVPLLLGFEYGNTWGVRGMGGVYSGFLLHSIYDFDGYYATGDPIRTTADRKNEYKAFDLGGILGFEGFFKISSEFSIHMGFQYQHGFTNMRDSIDRSDIMDQTRAFIGTAGLLFSL